MADRRDWIKFYFDDFCGDDNLQSCPLDTQGFYVHLMKVLNRSNPPGYLVRNGGVMSLPTLTQLLPWGVARVRKHLSILQSNGVLKQDENGLWYSKRMYEDWLEYGKHKANGAKGGNPQLVNPQVKAVVNPPLKAEREREREQEEERETDTRLQMLFQTWEQKITLVPSGDVLPALRTLLEWLENQIALKGIDDWLPPEEILSLEIIALADKLPDKQNVKYFQGMVQGKLRDKLEGK